MAQNSARTDRVHVGERKSRSCACSTSDLRASTGSKIPKPQVVSYPKIIQPDYFQYDIGRGTFSPTPSGDSPSGDSPDIRVSSLRSETPPPTQQIVASRENTDGYCIPRHLSLPIEDRATCFFYKNYIFVDVDIPYDIFAYVPAICGQIHDTKALSSLIACIGTAGLSNLHKDHQLMRKAQKIYSFTLRHTQNLLADSSQTKEDQTLLVVLLLALYEVRGRILLPPDVTN